MHVTTAQTRRSIAEYLLRRFPQMEEGDLASDASLLSAGRLDSLGVLELVAFLEQTFEIRLADEDMMPENFDRLSTLVEFVEQRR